MPSPRNEFSCATITISGLAGWGKRVGRSALESFILYVKFGNVPYNRVVTWYMGSGLKAQNRTGVRAQRKGLRAQKNGIRDHKAFEPKSGIRFIIRSKTLLSQYFSA